MQSKKIILVITDIKGRNVLFILDNLEAITLEQLIQKIENKEFTNLCVIKRKNIEYIRSKPNISKTDNLKNISISIKKIIVDKLKSSLKAIKDNASEIYWFAKANLLKIEEIHGKEIVYVDGQRRATLENVKSHILKYKNTILSAANYSKIDANLLGAILIDEYLQIGIDDIGDWLVLLEFKTSIGIAQVQVETARNIIKRGYYNPNLNDNKLSKKNIGKVARRHLYQYLNNPEHSIYFASAYIRELIDDWSPTMDISNEHEIIGSIYATGQIPTEKDKTPDVSDRGKQIRSEFYFIAKEILSK